MSFIGKKISKILSALIISNLVLSGAYNDPTFDINYYSHALSFPFGDPIKNYQWYTPKVQVKGENKDLPVGSKADSEISQEALNQIVKYAEENNSLGLMVVHHGKIITEKYFRDWNENLAGDSESMAKSVLSLLIGIAIDEGKIHSENDQVATYIPEWQNDNRKRIKIKHLLEMSSGLRNSSSTISPFSDLAKMHLGFNAKDLVLGIPSEEEPRKKFSYNNVNSQILGLLLERATGKTYAQYLSEKLWQPLGASDANLWIDNTGTARTYCCLFAKMRDWAKLGLLVLNKGQFNNNRIVSENWIGKMTTPSKNAKNYGYHIWMANSKIFKRWRLSEDFIDESMIFFDGRSKQRVFIFPKRDLVIVRVGDTSDKWKEDVIPNIISRDLK